MIGENIKALRSKNGMTQKDLADKLFVTPQAVSRWEKDIVEPNLETITKMAEVFNVTPNDILGITEPVSDNDIFNNDSEKPKQIIVEQRPVLAVCEKCNKPIYEADDICRSQYGNVSHIMCKECSDKLETKKQENINKFAHKCRLKSYIIGAIVAVIILALNIAVIATAKQGELDGGTITLMLLFPIFIFTFTSCMCLKNNFIDDMMEWAATFGFVKMPGVIFDLSLDGIIWLITVKLFLWILTFLISAIVLVAGFIIALPLSLFAYPFALRKSFKHPEDTMD